MPTEPLAALEAALAAAPAAEAVEAKLRGAQKAGQLPQIEHNALVQRAQEAGVISAAEAAHLAWFECLRAEVVRVDHFPQDFERHMLATAAPVRAAA